MISDNPASNERMVHAIRGELEHLLAMSDVAVRSKMTSHMNHAFLKAEMESFMEDVVGSLKKGDTTIAQSIKDVNAPKVHIRGLLPKKSVPAAKGHDKGHHIGHIRQNADIVFGEFKTMTGPIKDIVQQSNGGTDRKDKIYHILKEKGELTIKDIAGVAPEYSEKTIQRDLVEMVQSGKLKKKGERRWTTYYV